MKKTLLLAVVLMSLGVCLTGCPDTSNLTVMQNTLNEAGYPVQTTLNPLGSVVDARAEVSMTYQGGNGFGRATGEVFLVGETVSRPINIFPATKATAKSADAEKCLTCTGVILLGGTAAAAIGGTIATMIGENLNDDTFNIGLKPGDAVDRIILTVIGGNGRSAMTLFYGPGHYGITPPPTGLYHLSTMVSPANAGGISVSPNQDLYAAGVTVDVQAVANEGFIFDHWTVNTDESPWLDANASVKMDGHVLLIAVFKSNMSKLIVSISPPGAGSVTVNPSLVEYEYGKDVSLQANANAGFEFVDWTVNDELGTTSVSASVQMNSETVKVVAKFRAVTPPVGDVTPPVITLNGSATVNLIVGGVWVDPGATAYDAVDGVVNVTVTGNVNVTVVGNYVLTYHAVDRAGNASSITRTVHVATNADTKKLRIDLVWNGTYLTLAATNAPASGHIGLELYQPSAVWIERELWDVSSQGIASGTVTQFRSNISRILRCTVVTNGNVSLDGFVPNDAVIITLNGELMPLVANSEGKQAFQASV